MIVELVLICPICILPVMLLVAIFFDLLIFLEVLSI